MSLRYFILLALFFVTVHSCQLTDYQESRSPYFELLDAETTGLDFDNVLVQSEEFNVFYYMYYFNGGGLAGGDFNQDGLIDLYFTSNMGPNKFFLNEGEMKFKEVTQAAGLEGAPGWSSGASVVDINQDGLLDIYVSQVGDYLTLQGKNQLYVCTGIENGTPVFEDQAEQYGLDLVGFGTQATFFDYDLDGDLDMYQLNHSLHQNGTFGRRERFDAKQHPLSGDRLFRNDNGQFVDVTKVANIMSTAIGYGLGVATGDVNNDGWPDLYIGNDFHENDYLYLNQQDGTFAEVLASQMQHTSRFSMGVDIADINNDGWQDVFSLDMLPEDPFILKSSLGEDGYDIFQFKLGHGYHPQFSRNNLQLNNGNGTFSEVAAFAGVYASDWSWAPLFFDMDHDGQRDLFISNGIPRRMNDIDYVNFKTNDNLKFKEQFNDIKKDDLSYVDKMPEIKLKNKFYRNQGDLRFEDLEANIMRNQDTYSNSAIYADLDNDGDLDVVVNNIDDKPYVYENKWSERAQGAYLQVKLTGSPQNRNAIGARAVVFGQEQRLVAEHFPTRAYQASCLTPLHLGLGDTTKIDSILIVWPDQTYSNIAPTGFNQEVSAVWEAGLPRFNYADLSVKPRALRNFVDITAERGIDYVHDENPFVDFNREKLIPHKASAEGPALAVGDINGDGREDFFVGSSKRRRSALYVQQADGSFRNETSVHFTQDSVFEDVDAEFTDLDQDGDLDLVVAAGGNEYRFKQRPRLQRTYINRGEKGFKRYDAFPDAFMTASCIVPGDVNGDGIMDYFLGGRVVPWAYGVPPESLLFIGRGTGGFEEQTNEYAPELKQIGMVKDAQWIDIDQDGDLDLILALEWDAITIFENQNGKLIKRVAGPEKGWWNSIQVEDFDQDGDLDILAGNFGENTKLKPTPAEPITMYVNDFDDNDQVEPVLTYYLKGKEIPYANYDELTKQLVSLKKRYLYAKDLAAADLVEIFGSEKLYQSRKYTATTFQSMLYMNDGAGQFTAQPLPFEAQLSTINTTTTVKQDGEKLVLLGGNFKQANIEMGWYDASYGQLLKFTKNGEMKVSPLGNLSIEGEIRQIKAIKVGEETAYLVARNDLPLLLIKPE